MTGRPARNRYFVIEYGVAEIDLHAVETYAWGFDHCFALLREIEARQEFEGLTFYLAYRAPESLPSCGADVVLILLGEEAFIHRACYDKAGAVLRCYGAFPPYCDGWPVSALRRAALAQWLLRTAVVWKLRTKARLEAQRDARPGVGSRTFHIPLGLFAPFEPVAKPMHEREIDYAFLGSADDDKTRRTLLESVIEQPKRLSRRQMLSALHAIGGRMNGRLRTTNSFADSIAQRDDYAATLANTRISLVPRGHSYETYRFVESCKAGCAIICEPLPDTWFYRNHPGIVIRDWSKLPTLLDQLLRDEARLDSLAEASLSFWRSKLSEEATAAPIAAFLRSTVPAACLRRSVDGRIAATAEADGPGARPRLLEA